MSIPLGSPPSEESLRAESIRKVIKDYLNIPNLRVSQGAVELLTQVTTEFLEFIAVVAMDESERANHYIDSDGVISALNKMGFEDIVKELPEMNFSEDMFCPKE